MLSISRGHRLVKNKAPQTGKEQVQTDCSFSHDHSFPFSRLTYIDLSPTCLCPEVNRKKKQHLYLYSNVMDKCHLVASDWLVWKSADSPNITTAQQHAQTQVRSKPKQPKTTATTATDRPFSTGCGRRKKGYMNDDRHLLFCHIPETLLSKATLSILPYTYTVYLHLGLLADAFIWSDLQRVHLLKETAIYRCGT